MALPFSPGLASLVVFLVFIGLTYNLANVCSQTDTKRVSLGTRLQLEYETNATHGMFKLEFVGQGYVAFGIGAKMFPSVVILGMDPVSNPGRQPVGLYRILDHEGTLQVLAESVEQCLTYGIVERTYGFETGLSVLSFTIDLSSPHPDFTLIPTTGNRAVDIIYAAGPPTYVEHSTYGAVPKFTFEAATIQPVGFRIDAVLAAHAVMMIIAWDCLIALGVLVPLFNNSKRKARPVFRTLGHTWLKYHWRIQALGVTISIVGTALGIAYVNNKGATLHWNTPHSVLGLAILIGSVIQPLWGKFRPSQVMKHGISARAQNCFAVGHSFLGYFLLFAGMANCVIGTEELKRISGGTDTAYFSPGGSLFRLGNTGPIGVATILLLSVTSALVLTGWTRRYLHRNDPETTSTMPKVADLFQKYSSLDLMKHNSEGDCWVSHQGGVYDVTSFLAVHPGGKSKLLRYGGKDITDIFKAVGHSSVAVSLMAQFKIGDLEDRVADAEAGSIPKASIALFGDKRTADTRHSLRLRSKEKISPNTFRFEFDLPSPNMVLGLQPGQHLCLYAPAIAGQVPGLWNNAVDADAGKVEVKRKYTPISTDDVGYVTLVVKCYLPCERYPDGGRMGRHLHAIEVGDQVQMSGPYGTFQYHAGGFVTDGGKRQAAKKVAMIAGGSGITPIYQIARAMLLDAAGPMEIGLVFANSTHEDVLIKPTLDELEQRSDGRMKVWYTITSEGPADWPYSVGRVDRGMLQNHLPPGTVGTIAIVCGPELMKVATQQLLLEIGYCQDQIIQF